MIARPPSPSSAVQYCLCKTEGSDVEYSTPLGSRDAAVSVATWVMNGYIKDRYTVVSNPIKGRWTAYKGGQPGAITLEICETALNHLN